MRWLAVCVWENGQKLKRKIEIDLKFRIEFKLNSRNASFTRSLPFFSMKIIHIEFFRHSIERLRFLAKQRQRRATPINKLTYCRKLRIFVQKRSNYSESGKISAFFHSWKKIFCLSKWMEWMSEWNEWKLCIPWKYELLAFWFLFLFNRKVKNVALVRRAHRKWTKKKPWKIRMEMTREKKDWGNYDCSQRGVHGDRYMHAWQMHRDRERVNERDVGVE